MADRFVVHVGPHKTGSTYLQCAFTVAVEPLRARGILYPTGCGSLQGHFPLAGLLRTRQDAKLREWFDRFAETGAPTVLLSSEEFSALSRDELRTLKGLMHPADVTIVFHCRRPTEILLSGWREMVKHGITYGLPEHPSRALSDGSESETVNLLPRLSRIASVFGAESLRLVPYNDLIAGNVNLFQHFCARFLDWPDAAAPTIRRMNRSLSAQDAEFLRMMNVLDGRRPGHPAQRLYARFVAHRPSIDLTSILGAMQGHLVTLSLDETRAPFQGWHNRVRDRFGDALTDPTEQGTLYPPIQSDLTYVRTDYLAEPGVPDRLRELHAQIDGLSDPEPMAFVLRHL